MSAEQIAQNIHDAPKQFAELHKKLVDSDNIIVANRLKAEEARNKIMFAKELIRIPRGKPGREAKAEGAHALLHEAIALLHDIANINEEET